MAVEECVRRLRNCSPDLPWDQKADFLSDYMGRLKQAGYSEKFRIAVGMIKANLEGSQSLYRDSSWYRDPENRKKLRKSKD